MAKAKTHTLTSRGGTKRKLRIQPTANPTILAVTIIPDDNIDSVAFGGCLHIRKCDLLRIADSYR